MQVKNISIKDYTYHLPDEKIARHPLTERDASKLLVYSKKEISTNTFRELPTLLPVNSTLVFNNTKVVEARLLFTKPSGGKVEIFCLEPDSQYADIGTAMIQKGKVWWNCLVGGAKKWKEEILTLEIPGAHNNLCLTAKQLKRNGEIFSIELIWNDKEKTFADILHSAGHIPLPPYLKREVEKTDEERYQTVYASEDGSVAAPTAGLHFTPTVLEKLKANKIQSLYVTLHVGAGTFKPVKADTLALHDMHAEFIDVDYLSIQNLYNSLTQKIIAVGTTSLRTIETLYWMGVKIWKANTTDGYLPETIDELTLFQWDAYSLPQQVEADIALKSLLLWMEEKKTDRLITKTQLLIAPGYTIRIANGIITNFHQPESTLLLLIAALVGNDWRKIYDYALENDFRFLSYGDSSLLWKN
jgi:S-adenosylmethionine:tRNA ribosyltransferase-isomerase